MSNMKNFYGQFEPPVDQFIFERYFPNKEIKGTFVECGAFDGLTECSCKAFEESMGWKGYNIEPVPWIYERLCQNRPLSRNLNFALSNTIGEATFKAVDHPTFGKDCTNGSLTHTTAHSALLQEMGCTLLEVQVPLCTWIDFINKENITHIDLLVLDVEGHELSVIEGMHGCEILPDVICIEVGHLPFEAIRSALSKFNYIYDISSHVNAYFIKSDKLALFSLRRLDYLQKNNLETLLIENKTLQQHLTSLENILREIKGSKTWRVIELIRRWKAAIKQHLFKS
jgi:FkbM family methyltransferase